jgi:hypothetical protein
VWFAVGVAHACGQSASHALVGNAVPHDELPGAVILQALGMNLARAVGPAVAGSVVVAWSSGHAVLLYGLVGVASLLVLRLIPRLRQEPPERHERGLVARIRQGASHARERYPAAIGLATVAVTSLFGASDISQFPALAGLVTDDPGWFVILTSAGGVGAAVGVVSLTIGRCGPPSLTRVGLTMALLGAAVIALGWTRVEAVQLLLVGLAGAAQFSLFTMCNGLVQARSTTTIAVG